jgi:F-type H+-transporting ATPase subunit b
MELLSKLGIDWRLLIAQLVNFLILLFILYKFLYKPVLNLLENRREKIEKGLKDAEKMGEELEKIKALREEEIKKAKREAQEIIERAQKTAESAGREIKLKAKKEVEKLIDVAKNQIIDEKEKMLAEIKNEASTLVVAAAERVVGKVIDVKAQQKLIDETIREVSKR